MQFELDSIRVSADDFARRFSLRGAGLMWFLGAGSSASAGVPTAWDMIWEFKQQLFVSQRRVTPQTVNDLSNPIIRNQLQSHIDSAERFPMPGSPEEYAALFEAVYPAEADRRTYLESKIAGGKPSFGHIALATLMQSQHARLTWTTNFDPLIADACAIVYGSTGPLTTIDLDAPDLAVETIGEERWPIEVKLHGDFRSRRLKNTDDELRHQDTRLRQVFVNICQRFGLVVAGYSGRDESVMAALEESLHHSNAFPNGLFWLQRGKDAPFPRVVSFLEKAKDAGVDVALVSIENFDEMLRDIVRLIPDLETRTLDEFSLSRKRWSVSPRPVGKRGWPVVRLNALPVIHMPSVCRRVVCQIGGYGEVREAMDRANVDVLFGRTRAGVLAYGSDDSVRSMLDEHGISEFDLHTIEAKRLRYDSGERGLLRDALTRALSREHGLESTRRRSADLLAPLNPDSSVWSPLQKLVGPLVGTIEGNPEIRWREGISTRLDWADERLWLLIDPRTVFDGVNLGNKDIAADFARERTVRRYNRQLNELIAFWAELLSGGARDLRALGLGDGIDAMFRLSSETGYSRRATA